MEVGGSRFTSMGVSGSFHGSTWKFPLSVEVEASSTYVDLFPRVSKTVSYFQKTNPNPNLNPNLQLQLPPWKLTNFQVPWK